MRDTREGHEGHAGSRETIPIRAMSGRDVHSDPRLTTPKLTVNMLKMTSRVQIVTREMVFPGCAMSGRDPGREVERDLETYLTSRV